MKQPFPRYLGGVVVMYDIDDVEAFVQGTILRKVKVIPGEEMEEMVAEGLAIMAGLYRRYDPALERSAKERDPTHKCVGPRCCKPSFAGYASFILPKKLHEVWFARQPHFQSKKVGGKRTYVRYMAAVSLDERNNGMTMIDEVNDGTNSVQDLTTTRRVLDFVEVPIIVKGDNDGNT